MVTYSVLVMVKATIGLALIIDLESFHQYLGVSSSKSFELQSLFV